MDRRRRASRSAYSGENIGGGSPREEGQNDDFATVRPNDGGFGEAIGVVIASFHVDFGLQGADEFDGCVFVERDDARDGAEALQNRETVFQGVYGPVVALAEAADAGVGIHADDEEVPESAGFVEIAYVTRVEDVEYAVGEDETVAPSYLERFNERHRITACVLSTTA
jgi:hypothetical protein